MTQATDGVDRRLSWPDCLNVRDLGGLPTTNGGHIRRGALVRSDVLDRLTDEGIAAVRGYGIRRVIDLRTREEVTRWPGPFAEDPMYRWVPLIGTGAAPTTTGTLTELYRNSIDSNASEIVAGLVALADAPAGGVLVHCYAGKDRTGIHVALALAAAGVEVADIAADYALSAGFLWGHRTTATADGATAGLIDEQDSTPETIFGTLDHVAQRYGSVADYLCRHGMSQDQLAALRARLLAD